MNARRRLLDDIAGVATAAAGVFQGGAREAETLIRHRMEALLDRMELVTREEFDAVKAMAANARLENQRLGARVCELEATLAPQGQAKAKSKAPPRRRTAAKKKGAYP